MTRAGVDAASAGLLLRQLDLLGIDEAGLWRAGRLPSPPGTFLRTADAIHLIAAMELAETDFLTDDRRQARAAEARGFMVIAPGRPDGWHRWLGRLFKELTTGPTDRRPTPDHPRQGDSPDSLVDPRPPPTSTRPPAVPSASP